MGKLDQLTDVFFNWQVLLISFAVFTLISLVRQIGTRKIAGTITGTVVLSGWAESGWFKAWLPVMPYALAIGLIFLPGIPLPEVVVKSAPKLLVVKFLYAIYAGWLSDKSYQVVKVLLEKVGIIEEK